MNKQLKKSIEDTRQLFKKHEPEKIDANSFVTIVRKRVDDIKKVCLNNNFDVVVKDK